MWKLLFLSVLAFPACISVEECKENKCSVESKSSCGCKTNRLPGSKSETEPLVEADNESFLGSLDVDGFERTNKMALINGDTFVMGSDLPILLQDGEAPARRVKMSSFFMRNVWSKACIRRALLAMSLNKTKLQSVDYKI